MSPTLWIVHIDGPKADALCNGAVGPIEAQFPPDTVRCVVDRYRIGRDKILQACPVFEEDLWVFEDDYWVPSRSRNRVPSLEGLAFAAGLLGYHVERVKSSQFVAEMRDMPKVVRLEELRLEDDDGAAFEFEITSDPETEKPVLVGEGGRNEQAVEHMNSRLNSALRSLFGAWEEPEGPLRVDLYQDDEGSYWVRYGERVACVGDRYFRGMDMLINHWSEEWGFEAFAEFEDIISFDDWLAEQSREDASEPVAFFGPAEDRPLRQELYDLICKRVAVGGSPDHFYAIAGRATGLGAEWFRKRFEGEEKMSYNDVWLVKMRLNERQG